MNNTNIVFLITTFLFSSLAGALEVKWLGEERWDSDEKVAKTRLGGLSSLVIKDNHVYFLSDDRGLVNEPRFYRFQFESKDSVWKLSQAQVYFIKLPPSKRLKEVLDPESLVLLPSGRFLVSSEGDNNKKPRVPPRIFEVTPEGQWQKEINLPSLVVPESTGQQKKGVSNNFAFEAMALSANKDSIWFTSERPLVQDSTVEDSVYRFRMFHLNLLTEKVHQYYFEAPPPDSKAQGIVLASGWTELVHLSDKKFWMLERTLRLVGGKKLQYDCRLVEADFAKTSEVTLIPSLANRKDLISATYSQILRLENKGQALGNCEGMAVGPASGDFKQTLWVINDNNFSKNEDTILSFFGVKN